MSLFNRTSKAQVPSQVTAQLAAYGNACLAARRAGRPLTDPRFEWEPFLQHVHIPMAASPGNAAKIADELHDVAVASRDRDAAVFGAYRLIAEFNAEFDHRGYRTLFDASLAHLKAEGFSSGHLTGYEAARWAQTRGSVRETFDVVYEVQTPLIGDGSEVTPLSAGETRLLALTGPLPDGNGFYAERSADGKYSVFSERPRSDEDPSRQRYDESFLGTFSDLPNLFAAVGEMFGTPTYWAHPELIPFFPRRRA